jgi:hypothetical protein
VLFVPSSCALWLKTDYPPLSNYLCFKLSTVNNTRK